MECDELNLTSRTGAAVLVRGSKVVLRFTLDLASAGRSEMKSRAAFARLEKGLNLAVTSVRYRVIISNSGQSLDITVVIVC